ncbi:MAG: dienelactone hydrolase family protein, partial [Burkholderiaceae bacterium]|nr:dienelactone hydrolase family protein [Burkholderiaceae bacterium]
MSTIDNNMSDAKSLLDRGSEAVTRRAAMVATIGVGYAAAVLPEMAQAAAISTSGAGLVEGEVMVNVAGPFPVVLVLSEIFGVHEHIADLTRRFAQLGYMALAPELFMRQGDAQGYAVMADLMKEVVNKVPDAQVLQDLDAVVA